MKSFHYQGLGVGQAWEKRTLAIILFLLGIIATIFSLKFSSILLSISSALSLLAVFAIVKPNIHLNSVRILFITLTALIISLFAWNCYEYTLTLPRVVIGNLYYKDIRAVRFLILKKYQMFGMHVESIYINPTNTEATVIINFNDPDYLGGYLLKLKKTNKVWQIEDEAYRL